MEKAVIVVLLVTAVACGAAYITRINENGAIIAEPKETEIAWESRDSHVSEEGYVYIATGSNTYSLSEELEYINDVYDFTSNEIVALYEYRNNVIVTRNYYGNGRVTSSIKVLGLELEEKYEFDIPDRAKTLTVDGSDGSIWFSVANDTHNGIYKYDLAGDELYYFPNYNQVWDISPVASGGSFWAGHTTGEREIKRHGPDGSVLAEVLQPLEWYRADVYNADATLWLLEGNYSGTELLKIDALGNIVASYSGLNSMYAVSVNQNDGSVWVTNHKGDIAHVDTSGNEILRLKWFENWVYAIAVDPSDNSVIVFSDNNPPVNIEPSSLGEIKAMFR